MKNRIFLLLLSLCCLSGTVHAYTIDELREDCQAAEDLYARKKSTDPYQSIRGTRCMAYVTGFADGYGVGDYLADKVGVSLNAICLPTDGEISYRLIRAVLSHLERQPPSNKASTATLVAGALSKSFPCAGLSDGK